MRKQITELLRNTELTATSTEERALQFEAKADRLAEKRDTYDENTEEYNRLDNESYYWQNKADAEYNITAELKDMIKKLEDILYYMD